MTGVIAPSSSNRGIASPRNARAVARECAVLTEFRALCAIAPARSTAPRTRSSLASTLLLMRSQRVPCDASRHAGAPEPGPDQPNRRGPSGAACALFRRSLVRSWRRPAGMFAGPNRHLLWGLSGRSRSTPRPQVPCGGLPDGIRLVKPRSRATAGGVTASDPRMSHRRCPNYRTWDRISARAPGRQGSCRSGGPRGIRRSLGSRQRFVCCSRPRPRRSASRSRRRSPR